MDCIEHATDVKKIEESYLEHISEQSVLHFFGDWTQNIHTLRDQFLGAQPFEHVVIDNFLEDSYAKKISSMFPDLDSEWHTYKNPLEVKYAYDDIDKLSIDLKNYFYYLSTPEFTDVMKNMTGIDNLVYDEYLHGAGLHMHPRNGRLNIHLDYEKHPFSGKERRLNIILFMSNEWNPQWNGANELWNNNVSQCVAKTDVKFNRAVIFRTNDISWHGLPDKIMCPEGVFRKSLAYYYVSPLNTEKPEEMYRKKAKYTRRPVDPQNENMDKLFVIRENRRITANDLDMLVPDWTPES